MPGEPKLTTSYQDFYQSSAAASEENQLTIIGLASDGPMDSLQTFDGLSGLAAAEALFGKTGRLPHGIREAITTSVQRKKPVTVKAMRCGEDSAKARLEFHTDSTAETVLYVEYDYDGLDGNEWQGKWDLEGVPAISFRRGADAVATQFTPTSVAEAIEMINASSLPLTAYAGNTPEGDVAEISWTNFTGGLDGALTGAEVIRALQIAEDLDSPNIMILGANTDATRSAISTHTANQLSQYQIERYAGVELPSFDSTNAVNSAEWRLDVGAWVEAIETALDGEDDRNLLMFAGQAIFLDADGEEYEAPVSVAAMAAWLGEPIHQAMVNLKIPTVQRCVPEIPPEFRNRLADARVNYVYFETGQGYIVNNGRTLAADASDYKYAERLRTLYTCGAEARVAMKPILGKPDDPRTHTGLDNLQNAGEKPLEKRKGLTIVDYNITPTIDDEGNVEAPMGILPYNSMRWINHVVYLRR